MTRSDPARLLRSGTPAADLLRGYARRTTPGERDSVAAWYRLRPNLDADAGADAAPASGLRRLRRVCSPARLLTVALGVLVLVLVKLVPLAPVLSGALAAPAISEDGAAGWRGIDGAGGMEGAGG